MTALALPAVRGKLTADAPLAPLVWFKAGGAAQWLFEPADIDDLRAFLADADAEQTTTEVDSEFVARPFLWQERSKLQLIINDTHACKALYNSQPTTCHAGYV